MFFLPQICQEDIIIFIYFYLHERSHWSDLFCNKLIQTNTKYKQLLKIPTFLGITFDERLTLSRWYPNNSKPGHYMKIRNDY